MAELKKKATRESYGEALAELGDKIGTSMFLTQTLLLQQKQVYSKRNSLTDFLTAVSPSQI